MASAWNLEEFFRTLESWGLTDVMLPFLIIFTIMFAILQKTRVLGEGRKNMNMILSLAIALVVIIPHVTDSYSSPEWDPVNIMNSALPTVSIVAIAIIMMLVLIGILGGEAKWMGGSLSGWIAIIALAIIIIIFGGAADWWSASWLDNIIGQDAIAVIIIILVFGLIIAFVTGSDEDSSRRAKEGTVMKHIGDFFKGGK